MVRPLDSVAWVRLPVGAKLVGVAGRTGIHLGKPVQRVIGEAGLQAIGVLGRGQIAGRVVVYSWCCCPTGGYRPLCSSGRGRHSVADVRAVRIGRGDGLHFAPWVVIVAQVSS